MRKKKRMKPVSVLALLWKWGGVLIYGVLPVFLSAGTVTPGDVDGDGRVGILDAVKIEQYVAGMEVLPFFPIAADVTADGQVDLQDVLKVAHYATGLITGFLEPVPTPTPLYPSNWNTLQRVFPDLSPSQKEKLFDSGFVMLDSHSRDYLSTAYLNRDMQRRLPLLVTSDMLLHLFHITYTDMLYEVELRELYPCLKSLLARLLTRGVEVRAQLAARGDTPFLEEAAGRVLVYCAVGYGLLHNLNPPVRPGELGFSDAVLLDEVNRYLSLIGEATLVEPPPGEDFTLYKPRGHYTRDVRLCDYFKAGNWLRRRKFDLPGQDMAGQLRSAAILARIITSEPSLMENWGKVTGFLLRLSGESGDYTPRSLEEALEDYFSSGGVDYRGEGFLLLETVPLPLLSALLASPEPELKSLRIMGEAPLYYPEAQFRLLDGNVAGRFIPGGMELAASLLDSPLACELMEEDFRLFNQAGADLETALSGLRQEYNDKGGDFWNASLYSRWHKVLRTLSVPVSGTAPHAFRTRAWAAGKLNTQLASWTELHSDSYCLTYNPTPTPTITPYPEPTSTPYPTPPGTTPSCKIYFEPDYLELEVGMIKKQVVIAESGETELAGFLVNIHYDPDMLYLDMVSAGSFGTGILVNDGIPGNVTLAGFDIRGRGPSLWLPLCTLSWKGYSPGGQNITLGGCELVSTDSSAIFDFIAEESSVQVRELSSLRGDADYNGVVEMVDALKVAQYVVGLIDDSCISPWLADVQPDGNVDIIDALMIVSYLIGRIDSFPPAPAPTPLPALIEPYPDFFTEFEAMCAEARTLVHDSTSGLIHESRFGELEQWAGDFSAPARDVAAGRRLSPGQNGLLRSRITELGPFFDDSRFVSEESARSRVIFDLYAHEETVVHMAVGKLHPVIMLYQENPQQLRPLAVVGYCLSYYEPRTEGSRRLSDEEWNFMLDTNPPYRPAWTDLFLAY